MGDGEPLRGEIRKLRARPRVRRDEVSGEPLPPEDEPEIVIFAEILYPFTERPERIVFQPFTGGTGQAAVGFVVYHQGVAVNDFRYLTSGYVLALDWDDPWYSAFSRRALRRAYWAPMSGFLYVEPFEVRKEIIVRPMDLQRFLDLGLTDRKVIAAMDQPEMLRKVAEFLRPRHEVLIDGVEVVPELALIPTVLIVGRRVELNEKKSRALVGGLLHNVYTSFDFRDEERVYDFLEKTVTGDLLDRIYLETRKSLELESQGGARTKVKAVELTDLGTTRRREGGIVVEAAWTVTGSIGHWGHVHQRQNRYVAKLTMKPRDGEWKLADVEIIEEERL